MSKFEFLKRTPFRMFLTFPEIYLYLAWKLLSINEKESSLKN